MAAARSALGLLFFARNRHHAFDAAPAEKAWADRSGGSAQRRRLSTPEDRRRLDFFCRDQLLECCRQDHDSRARASVCVALWLLTDAVFAGIPELAMSGTIFSIAATLLAALILSGFRLWLYFSHRSELETLALGERLRLFWVGFRLDGVIVSRSLILLVLLTLLLPDSILTLIRPFLLAYLGVVLFIFFLAETSGLYFFSYYGTRFNYLVFEHGSDPEVLKA